MEKLMNVVRIERSKDLGFVVSSRVIANELGKKHTHVLESLEKILQSQENSENRDFGSLIKLNNYKVANQYRTYKEYLLTKDGFTLYMFNIQGHNEFKIRYINEFNRMERELEQEKMIENKNVVIPLKDIDHFKALEKMKNELLKRDTALNKLIYETEDNLYLMKRETMKIHSIIEGIDLAIKALNK